MLLLQSFFWRWCWRENACPSNILLQEARPPAAHVTSNQIIHYNHFLLRRARALTRAVNRLIFAVGDKSNEKNPQCDISRRGAPAVQAL